MLFVWMMSLMVGFANACVLDSHHSAQRHASVASANHHESRVNSSAEHAHDDSLALGACESFCSATETGISKYAADTKFTNEDSAPLLIQTWIDPATNFFEVKRFECAAPNGSEPPVHIRYLRLTI